MGNRDIISAEIIASKGPAPTLTANILRYWSREKIEQFAKHLLGDKCQNCSHPTTEGEAMSVKDYSENDLLRRAVRGARARESGSHERWVAVMDVFSLGSTYARELCRIHDVDPYEKVDGATCIACNP